MHVQHQSRIRFLTAEEVFAAFPAAYDDISIGPSRASPLEFVVALAKSPTPEDAIVFLAYTLPRREAVWWASQCIRHLPLSLRETDNALLGAAEIWVRDPDDSNRRMALKLAESADRRSPATWTALAAGWSGGSMTTDTNRVPVPAELTAKAVRVAVLAALARTDVRARGDNLLRCLDLGLRIAGHPTASPPGASDPTHYRS